LDSDEASARVIPARHLALKNRWEEGRAELDRADTLIKEEANAYRQLSRRAAFEFKAGDLPKGEDYINRAKATLNEPTVLWLSLAIEASRYKLGDVFEWRFERDLHKGLGRKANGETAGHLARLIGGFFASRMDYDGRKEHAKAVLGYLQKTKRLKYREPDLRQVCSMLQYAQADDRLLEQLLDRGKKLFPQSPFFLFKAAQANLKRGPFAFNSNAIQNDLEKAIALAEASRDPEDSQLVQPIKEFLAHVRTLGDAMATLPFGRRGMPGSPEEMLDMFNEMFVDSDDDDPDFEDSEPPPNRQQLPPKRKPR
jgi:hypothetical protein